jgi:hypothetical protein
LIIEGGFLAQATVVMISAYHHQRQSDAERWLSAESRASANIIIITR